MRWLSALMLLALALSGCTNEDDGLVDEDDPGGADSGIRGGGSGEGSGVGGDGGGDGDGDGGGGSDGDGNVTSDGRRTPVVWTIEIRDNAYQNGTITIQRDDRVHWVHNDQSTEHTVTADDGSFDSGSESGAFMNHFTYASFSHRFNQTGEYPYHCVVHPGMTGTITVLDVYAERP